MSSSSCEPLVFQQTEIICQDNVMNIYRKEISVIKGEWILYSTAGCCGCGGSSSSGNIQTNCCAETIPSILTVTVTNGAGGGGGCGCVGSLTFSLVYNSGTSQWEGSELFGSCGLISIQLAFGCNEAIPQFELDMTFSDSCATVLNSIGTLSSCDPFHWNADVTSASLTSCGCGAPGILNFDITE